MSRVTPHKPNASNSQRARSPGLAVVPELACQADEPAPQTKRRRSHQKANGKVLISDEHFDEFLEEEEEDAPADSEAHARVKYGSKKGNYWGYVTMKSGEKVHVQTVLAKVDGCHDTAARICRLCFYALENELSKEEVYSYRDELYRRHEILKARRAASDQGGSKKAPAPAIKATSEEQAKATEAVSACTAKESAEPAETSPAAAHPEEEEEAEEAGEAEEDAPESSMAHQKVKYIPGSNAYAANLKVNGEAVHVQATVVACGGCHKTAARIARLCFFAVEEGLPKEEVYEYRNEMYRKAAERRLGSQRSASLHSFWGKGAEDRPDQSAEQGRRPRSPSAGATQRPQCCGQNATEATVEKFSEHFKRLMPSDVDSLPHEDITNLERELGLPLRRDLPERIARLEQLAQRTTLTWPSAPPGSGRVGADASFLQFFLLMSPEERRLGANHADISRLERTALIEDGVYYTMAERRERLKAEVWEHHANIGAGRQNWLRKWLRKPSDDKL